MYPDQPTPSQSPAPDYLNQIAPQAPKKQIFKFGLKQILMIGAALVVLVIIVAITVNVIVSNQRRPLQELAASLTATQTLVSNGEGNIKSSQLRGLNSNLRIYLTNTNRDIAAPLLSAGVNTEKIDESVTKEESGDAITARLENARLNARYDRVYALEMSTQLEKIIILMSEILNSTNNSKLKVFLEDARSNLQPTQEALGGFDGTNS